MRFCQTVRRKRCAGETRGELAEPLHLRRAQPADRHGNADIRETVLPLRMNADMAMFCGRRPRLACGQAAGA